MRTYHLAPPLNALCLTEYYEKQLTSSEAATLDAHNKRERSIAARTLARALNRAHDLKVDDAANELAKSPAAVVSSKQLSPEACGSQCTGLPACKAFVYNSESSLCSRLFTNSIVHVCLW